MKKRISTFLVALAMVTALVPYAMAEDFTGEPGPKTEQDSPKGDTQGGNSGDRQDYSDPNHGNDKEKLSTEGEVDPSPDKTPESTPAPAPRGPEEEGRNSEQKGSEDDQSQEEGKEDTSQGKDKENKKASYTVYVYVAGKNDEGQTLSEDCLKLLGIDSDTLDNEGYFPIGEITLDNYLAAAKYNSVEIVPQNTALITSEEILTAVKQDLKTLYTTNLENDNKGNYVTDYSDQVIAFYGSTGSDGQSTMLCRRDSNYKTSHGFSNESDFDILFHLDLCFNTKTITFELGNNSLDNDGTVVDTRTYIEGCEIQDPSDFSDVIPAHYNWDGKYYKDADFNEEWDGIGTALTEDQTVYIRLVAENQVFINYAVAEGEGTLSTKTETLYSDETASGSTATAADNYTFEGWYADEACTTLLSNEATYIPTTPEGGWVNGTTYYAKFVKVEDTTPVDPTPAPDPTPSDKKDNTSSSDDDNDDDDDYTPSTSDDNDDDVIDIDDGDTPSSDLPDEEIPTEEEPIDVEDEDVPMADVPKTGDNSVLYLMSAVGSGFGGLAALFLTNKKKEKGE